MSDVEPPPNTPQLPSGDARTVNTGGGAYFEGNVTVHGDLIGRDKIVNIHPPSREEIQNRKNLSVMRQAVRKFWIEGVLDKSLYNEALIRLNMAERADAVDNRPWNLMLQEPGAASQMLLPGTRILDVFDDMQQRLLILGEPGSGKTTTLLELARDLLDRADGDPTQPTPVVFNLSSWALGRKPLAEWLVDELRERYSIPKAIAQSWIKTDALLLLLDGLDEVQAEHRDACAQAINAFRQAHMAPLAVCSRTAEYEQLAGQLKLDGAVVIQPLTAKQTDAYLDRAGASLVALRAAIQQDDDLREIAESPLLLSIMTLAYQGASPAEVSELDATQTRRKHLFDTYIGRMFIRREVKPLFAPHKTLGWLRWLAQRLMQYEQTTFLIEQMQPGWLQPTKARPWGAYALMALWGPTYTLAFVPLWLLTYVIDGSRPTQVALFFYIILCLGVMLSAVLVLSDKLLEIRVDQLGEYYARIKQKALSIFMMAFVAIWCGLTLAWVRFSVFGKSGASDAWSGLLVVIPMTGLLMIWFELRIFEPLPKEVTLMDETTQIKNRQLPIAVRGVIASALVGLLASAIYLQVTSLFTLLDRLQFAIMSACLIGLFGRPDIVIKHYLLRFALWLQGSIPRNYVRFLDYAAALIFLRKVGGGYIFVHRLVMEHFAGLSDADIQRIVSAVPGQAGSTKK
jgi:hypothetical protein